MERERGRDGGRQGKEEEARTSDMHGKQARNIVAGSRARMKKQCMRTHARQQIVRVAAAPVAIETRL